MVVVKTEIKCSSCRKETLHAVRVLVKAKTARCPFCQAETDLAIYRPRLRDLSEKYREMEKFLDGPQSTGQ